MTQNERLVNYLNSGKSITSTVARKKLGVRNLRARVNELRRNGICVYTNRNANGTSYRIGTPSRNIVAVAYQAAGSTLFGN
jgi:hypothetical protein